MTDIDNVKVDPPNATTFGGYTDAELHRAFDMVKNRTNWKEPINAVIAESDLDIVTEAVIYFTGCLIDVWPYKEGRVRVTAAGYYAQIGA